MGKIICIPCFSCIYILQSVQCSDTDVPMSTSYPVIQLAAPTAALVLVIITVASFVICVWCICKRCKSSNNEESEKG